MLSETSHINSPDVYLLIYFVMLWCALTLNMFTFHPINDQIDSRTNKTSWWHLRWLEIKMPHYCQFNWVSSLSARCSVRPLLATVFMSCLTLVNIFQVEKFNRMLQNFPPKFIKRTLGQSCNFHRKLQQIIFHNVFHLHQCEALKSPKWRVNPPLFQFRDWIDCCLLPPPLPAVLHIFNIHHVCKSANFAQLRWHCWLYHHEQGFWLLCTISLTILREKYLSTMNEG